MARKPTTLDGMIAAAQAKYDKYDEQEKEIARKKRTYKAELDKLNLMKNSQQLSALSNALNGKGISIDDILRAVDAGDLLTLQEKLDNVGDAGNDVAQSVGSVADDNDKSGGAATSNPTGNE